MLHACPTLSGRKGVVNPMAKNRNNAAKKSKNNNKYNAEFAEETASAASRRAAGKEADENTDR